MSTNARSACTSTALLLSGIAGTGVYRRVVPFLDGQTVSPGPVSPPSENLEGVLDPAWHGKDGTDGFPQPKRSAGSKLSITDQVRVFDSSHDQGRSSGLCIS